jgi:hypothetical protein
MYRNIAAAVAVGLALAAAQPAQAAIYSGSFNGDGYALIPFSVVGNTQVDIQWISGYGDATFNLFDSLGNFIIHNDDVSTPVFSLDPRVTQILPTGNYSLLVSYCCADETYLGSTGAGFVPNDGFTTGFYLTGGTGTLAGLTGYLQGLNGGDYPQASYNLSITGEVATPEPASMAVLAMGLVGLAASRRRNRSAN